MFNPTPGTVYSDIETWIRRIIKSPSQNTIASSTIADYVNRFYTYDAPARLQLFEMKTQYVFETIPNQFIYQFPYQNFQMIEQPVYCDGVQMGFYQSNMQFYNIFPELVNNQTPIQGNGTTGPYSITFAQGPILKGFKSDNQWQSFGSTPPTSSPLNPPVTYNQTLTPYVFITAYDVSGNLMYVVDDGEGNLIQTDATFQNPPGGPQTIGGVIVNPPIVGSVNYITGTASVTFNNNVSSGVNIETQSSPYSSGRPRICLFFNNTIKLYPVPDRSYKIVADAFITPAQFLSSSSANTYGYMAEWIARGAARKILTDNGDTEQLQLYEPFFREQENFVLRRTSRQNSTQRTPTIFSSQFSQNPYINAQY